MDSLDGVGIHRESLHGKEEIRGEVGNSPRRRAIWHGLFPLSPVQVVIVCEVSKTTCLDQHNQRR